MKEEVKDLWVAALRSGRYKQEIGALETCAGSCCLGVLTREFMVRHPGVVRVSNQGRNEPRIFINPLINESSTEVLLGVVQKWAGVANADGLFDFDASFTSLTEMNDEGVSFDEIADSIEKHWREL